MNARFGCSQGRAATPTSALDCVGFLAGSLSAVLPSWAMLLIGSAQNFLGYGWLWLIVTRQAPALPLWMNDQMLDKGMVVMGAPQGQQNGFKEAANSVEFL
ncbi:hypothetical protein ACJX0J_022020, partial [Zea mays]